MNSGRFTQGKRLPENKHDAGNSHRWPTFARTVVGSREVDILLEVPFTIESISAAVGGM